MNKPVTVVVLAKYWEVFKGFLETSEFFIPDYDKVLVKDADSDIPEDILGGRWKVVAGLKPFEMAGNGNIGLKAASQDSDILYCGDDVRFFQKDTINKLQEVAYQDSAIGILTPRIIGRGSPSQVTPMAEVSEVPPLEMWFPCIYIKREVIEKVGYLDEQFSNFGCDDLDYCLRVKQAGYKLCVSSKVAIKHEASPEGGPTTFVKKFGVNEWQKQQADALGKLLKKYDVSTIMLDRVIRGGDVRLLTQKPSEFRKKISIGDQPPKEECETFLKSRHIFVGTPAYAGNCHITYVDSLIRLKDACRDLGIDITISFLHNESLITRARNTLVDRYFQTNATDFFWIDADIGFDARDVINLTMYDEDVICIPCVRKNLRVDRVVSAVKKNGRDYSIDELENMMGEFVFNFPPNAAPQSINLGGLVEVMDGGSGLMRVKRETFTNVMEKFPERKVMQLTGESGGRKPVYMFFQAEPDFTVEGQDIPDYISEDYSFCRLVRRAGMKVWVAPWCRTTHAGVYLFKGHPEAAALSGGSLR